MLSVASFLADAAPSVGGGLTQTLIMVGIAVVFFYFILFRPEQKRRKAAEQMRNSIKKGDRVTVMGIIGKVDRIQDQTLVLKLIDGAKMEVLKTAVSDVQSSQEDEARKPEAATPESS